jgi:hypothetical protein
LASAQANLPVIPDPVLPKGVKAPLATVASITTAPKKVAAKSVKPSYQVAAPVQLAAVTPAKTAKVLATPKPARVKRPTLADAEIVGKTCGTDDLGRSVRCGPESSQPADYILKRLPAGITVRKADGGMLTTTEPTLVRVAIKKARTVPVTAPAVLPIPVQVPAAPRIALAPAPSAPSCNGLSGNAAQYMVTSSRLAVRCGPQAEHPSAYLQRQNQRVAQANTTVAQVAQAGRELGVVYAAPKKVRTPKGYVRTFDDGRLNPNRGPRTLAGDYQQAQVWTDTVPAYAIGQKPHLTFWEKLFGTHPQARATAQPVVRSSVSARVSTKSVAPVTTPLATQTARARPSAGQALPVNTLRYVQVGTFGVPANADKSIARLAAMGLPVSAQVSQKSGKPLKMVLAGPFASSQQTLQALAQARSAGYSDAFARK